MIRKRKVLTLSALLLLFLLSVLMNIFLFGNLTRLDGLLSEQGTVVLSPSLSEALLSDLKSADEARLQQWGSFLSQCRNPTASYNGAMTGLNETFKLYESKEKPGRSNYFNRMVFQLQMKQSTAPLSKQALLGFLGPPDSRSEGPDGQVLGYRYWSDGNEFLASALVTNETVVRIEIAGKPR
jgi:hypothetical protein